MKRFILFYCLTLLPLTYVWGQEDYSNSSNGLKLPYFSAGYGYQVPFGDMAKRFGPNHTLDLSLALQVGPKMGFGLGYAWIFGNQIKDESILSTLKTSDDFLPDKNGNPTLFYLYERGFQLHAHVSYLIPALGPNKLSGFLIKFQTGYMQHKIQIHIEDTRVPQLEGEYKKGYDQLSGGLCFGQFIGYRYLSNSRRLNFYGGLEFNQCFGRALRSYDFEQMAPPESSRFDGLVGIKLGWILPFYRTLPADYFLD